MKKGIGTALTLAALAVLAFLPGCRGGELTEEERQKLIAEMGEEGRAYQEKRRRFLESPLCAAGLAYLREAVDALVPGGNPVFSLEPGDYIDAEEAELNAVPDTVEEWKAFFSRAEAVIQVNFWDFDADGRTLAEEFMARGISGRLMADEYNGSEWIMDAASGEVEYYVRPGV